MHSGRELVKRDANSQLAFLSFVMAMLNAVDNIVSGVNSNNNNNNKVRTFWKGLKNLKQSPTWFDIY